MSPSKNLCPISSAVLTFFFGYKQTDRQAKLSKSEKPEKESINVTSAWPKPYPSIGIIKWNHLNI